MFEFFHNGSISAGLFQSLSEEREEVPG